MKSTPEKRKKLQAFFHGSTTDLLLPHFICLPTWHLDLWMDVWMVDAWIHTHLHAWHYINEVSYESLACTMYRIDVLCSYLDFRMLNAVRDSSHIMQTAASYLMSTDQQNFEEKRAGEPILKIDESRRSWDSMSLKSTLIISADPR